MKFIKIKHLIILLFIFFVFGFVKNGFTTTIEIVQGKLLVNGEPFTIKGVVYSPVPVGDDPEIMPPYGDYFTPEFSSIYSRDLPLLRQMGANTIRIMAWDSNAAHTDFLDKAYNGGTDPIYVIVTFWMGPSKYPDISTPEARTQIKSDFRNMVATLKEHPAILMWSIGNELNAPWMYGDRLNDLFSLINEMAQEAHIEEGLNYHPVTTPLVDINIINLIGTYESSMTALDIWNLNIYRGQSFGSLFSDYASVSNKPLLISEFGIDAYDHVNGDEYENTGLPYQAIYAHDLWNEIKANSDVCLGGTLMAYSDEWWKGKYSTDPGCPDYNPSIHSTCGYTTGSHPDGYSNEEWWGIMRTVANGDNPDIMQPREVFSTLQYIYKGRADCPSYIFFGETISCSIDAPGEGDIYTFTANANDKVLVRAGRTSGSIWPGIRVYDSGGAKICEASGSTSAEISSCTLSATGTYTILIYDSFIGTYTGNYNLYLQRLNNPGNSTTISIGQTLSGTINGASEMDAYTFTANANDKVLVRAGRTSGSIWPGIRVYDSGGAKICEASGSTSAEISSCTLSATGTYTILIYDSFIGTYTGNYNLYVGYSTPGILEITPNYGLVSSGPQTGPFSPSSKVYTLKNTGNEPINWTASKTQEWVSLSSTSGTLAGGASTNVTVSINSNANSLTPDTYDDTVTFTNVTNGSGDTTRSVSLTVREIGVPISLPLGNSERITVQNNQPIWFETIVPEGSPNLFILLQKDTSWSGTLEVYKDDVILKSTSGSNDFAIQIPNPAPGTYTTKLSGSGSGVITALSSLTELTLGEWTVGTILRQWGSVWYQVNVPSGQSMLSVSVETLGIWSKLEVFYGSLGISQKWSATGDRMNLEITSPQAGMYCIHLTDSAWGFGPDTSRDHLIKADVNPIEPPPPTEPLITNIFSTKGGNTGSITITINGAQLDPDATVWLSRTGENDIIAQSVTGSDDKKSLTALFDLTGANPGEWTLTVQSPDGQTVAAPTLFTIESGGEAKLWVEIIGRQVMRAGREQTLVIHYGNRGSIDAIGVPLWIAVEPQNASVVLDIDIIPPTLPEGVEPVDWSQVPLFFKTENEVVFPLELPVIPAGADMSFTVAITVPTPGEFGLKVWVGEPEYQSLQDLQEPNKASATEAYVHSSSFWSAECGLSAINAIASCIGIIPGVPSLDCVAAIVWAFDSIFTQGVLSAVDLSMSNDGGTRALSITQSLVGGYAAGKSVAEACLKETLGPISDFIEGLSCGMSVGSTIIACWPRKDAGSVSGDVVTSISPEDKYGPSGYDTEGTAPENLKRYILGDHALTYKIDFWNKEDAPAPTQDVIITDQLDTDLDWNSFSFTEFGFLKWKIQLEGGQYFNVDVDLRPDNNLIVNVEGTFDPETGEIRWEFHSLDPLTYEPPEDPMAGFLPPITDTGYEIGWVMYDVNPKQGLPSGTQITNQAWVKFDVDVFKPAPPNPDSEIPGYGPYLNTIDAGVPTSQVLPLSTTQSTTNFTVSLGGSDDEGGSGIKDYDIYVSDNGGPYTLWLTTSDTSATFTGENGHQYSFYSKARDNVGNIENAPAEADASTTINITTYDLDGDGDVDVVDIMKVASRWNNRVGDPNYDPTYDLDSDGDIDIVDIMKVAAQWGWTA